MMPTPFALQPTLRGELLELRPLRADDFEELYRCASDPLIWELHPQPTRYRREVFQGFFDGALQSGGAFAVLDRATGAIIGSSRYYDVQPDASRAIIGYTFLARAYWGGRFNLELKRLMLTHAFQFVGEVIFQIGRSNLRSRRAIEKIGARLAGEAVLDGKPHVLYRLTLSDARAAGTCA